MSARAPRTSRSGPAILAMSAAALVAMVLVPAGARAQAPDTLLLTLERALEIAEARNPSYRRAYNDVQLNGTEARTTWLDQVLPRANITLFNTGFNGNRTGQARDPFGDPIERAADWVYFSSTRQSLGLQWTIRGPSLFQAIRRQRLTNEGREVEAQGALSQVQVGVRRRYMDVLEQRELLRAEEALVEARRKDREVVDRLFSLGVRNRVDVLNADLEIERQALAAQQQRAAFQRSELALRTELGEDELPPFSLAEEPLPLFDPASLDAEMLVRTALEVNPGLREQRSLVDLTNLGLAESRGSWWPELSMGFSVTRNATGSSRTQDETSALFDVSFDEDLDRNFFVVLSLPMFNNYFSNQLSIHRAEVSLDNQREAEREARLGVEQNVRGAILDLQNQRETLRLAERSSSIAGEALRLTQEEYRIGTRSFEELRQSIEQEANTLRQVIQARHGFVDALLSLEEAVGTTVTPVAGA